jgi:TFIIF-interacting CTD phosphatase-like protein
MNIVKKNPEVYGLQKVGKNCHRIVRILKEYKSEQDAIEDMTKLLTGEITEQDLIEGMKK